MSVVGACACVLCVTCTHTHRLAVGTDKGLTILDTFTNTFIQVIGSENKLL